MICTRNVTSDLVWVGGCDRRLSLFEGVYPVPDGMAYNAYLLLDEKTVLFDTVDRAVGDRFFANVEGTLAGRPLDYVVVQHVEPDHSATLFDLIRRCPGAKIVCNQKTQAMIAAFFGACPEALVVKEGDVLTTGRHTLRFITAPMVHWPEVMVTFDETDGTLFSADAFGTFGALDGALFADEVDFSSRWLPEARRYYVNIVGKYGTQVLSLLKKTAGLKIARICPLHGFVWRLHIGDILEKYRLWASYQPEEKGVLIAYASVYGHTAEAAERLAISLRERGVTTAVYDVSVTDASTLVAEAFRYSHLALASTTYNAGIFVKMEDFLRDLAAHHFGNRAVALIENGSWAPTSGGLMKELLSAGRGIRFLNDAVTIRSAANAEQEAALSALADVLAEDIGGGSAAAETLPAAIDNAALFRISYGLYVLTAREGDADNGCIINTAQLLTTTPLRISIAVNKQNHTHDMIRRTGTFNLSVLTESAPFSVFERFGFASGREVNKFAADSRELRTENGVRYLSENVNAVISGKVVSTVDCGTHTLFIAEVTAAARISEEPSVTYDYYFAHIKPKPQPPEGEKKGFVCKICGYIYEGDSLPEDFICPICKHGAGDFEKI